MFANEDMFRDSDEEDVGGGDDTLVESMGAASLNNRATYAGGSGGPVARPGSASLPVRPVSARTFGSARAGAAATQNYSNDLFADELDEVDDATRQSSVAAPNMMTQQRLQQQRQLQAQKRRDQILTSGMAVSNTERPGSAAGARPGSAYGARPTTPAMATAMGRPFEPPAPAPGSLRAQYGGPAAAPAAPAGAQRVETTLQSQGISSVYDPSQDARPAAQAQAPAAAKDAAGPPRALTASQVDTSDMRVFLMRPGPLPGEGAIQCHIRREKGSMGYPSYSLWLEGEGGPGSRDGARFLLSARKRKKSKTSNYLISLDEDDLTRQSGNYFGKLRSNFVGTEFTIYDKGVKPKEAEASAGVSQLAARAELGAVMYQYNVLGTRGPRKMTALVPEVSAAGQRYVFRPENDKDCMLKKFKDEGDSTGMVVLRNKPPKWNEVMQAYCLNFNGRVTQPSVKNFQLVAENNREHTILQFGKVDKDVFTMDYAFPMSALQAFSICLSAFDNKLACE